MGKLGVVVVAAGTGSRMRSSVSKQYLLLQGKQIIIHTLEVFQSIDHVDEIVLVVGKQDVQAGQNIVEQHQLSKVKKVIDGGDERQSSVYKGLQGLSDEIEWVMVHDGVRPFVTENNIIQLFKQTLETGAAVLAVPVKETAKMVNEEGVIEFTPDRSKLWSIQTPQAFRLNLLLEAHRQASDENFLGTDDSVLVERIGIPVHIVQGEYTNIKITTPDDLLWAEFLLKERNK